MATFIYKLTIAAAFARLAVKEGNGRQKVSAI